MEYQSRLGMRLLKAYVVLAATLLIALGFFSLRETRATTTRFGEIDVERLNIVEKDGKARLILSNKARFPGLMVENKEQQFPREVAGIVFIDAEGNEFGSLTTQTHRAGKDFGAYSGLRYGEVGMLYNDDNGQREAGLFIENPPLLQELLAQGKAGQELDAPTRARLTAQLRRGEGIKRVRIARLKDQSAAVELSDVHGKPRLRLLVDAAGEPRLEFLDAAGKVTRALSGAAEAAQR